MGIFGFLKKKEKTTLLSDIKKASAWITDALNYSNYKLDINMESIKEIDRFFNEQMDDSTHTPQKGGLLSERKGQKLFAIGSFIGEVIINEYGGKWITDDNDKHGEINIAVELSNGTLIWPVQRVMKRCAEGSGNDIYSYVVIASRKF